MTKQIYAFVYIKLLFKIFKETILMFTVNYSLLLKLLYRFVQIRWLNIKVVGWQTLPKSFMAEACNSQFIIYKLLEIKIYFHPQPHFNYAETIINITQYISLIFWYN